jgi:hypothetical protein
MDTPSNWAKTISRIFLKPFQLGAYMSATSFAGTNGDIAGAVSRRIGSRVPVYVAGSGGKVSAGRATHGDAARGQASPHLVHAA